jgi:hypothetical protein
MVQYVVFCVVAKWEKLACKADIATVMTVDSLLPGAGFL